MGGGGEGGHLVKIEAGGAASVTVVTCACARGSGH